MQQQARPSKSPDNGSLLQGSCKQPVPARAVVALAWSVIYPVVSPRGPGGRVCHSLARRPVRGLHKHDFGLNVEAFRQGPFPPQRPSWYSHLSAGHDKQGSRRRKSGCLWKVRTVPVCDQPAGEASAALRPPLAWPIRNQTIAFILLCISRSGVRLQ